MLQRHLQAFTSHASLLIVGGAFAVYASWLYLIQPYTEGIFWLWLAGLLLMGCYFFLRRTRVRLFDRWDMVLASTLVIAFGFLYLTDIYQIPYQINTDEITIMYFMRKLTMVISPDPFALSDYFQFPSMIFILFGKIGLMSGGVTLEHIRTIHALSGVLIIVASYFFFRLFMKKYYAVGGALIVGSNHALFAISRMAMRDNVATLIEIVGLAFLLRGFEKKSSFESYLGGIVAGFGFYNYFPARITLVLWALYLVAIFFFYRRSLDWRWVGYHIAAVSVAFVATIAPLAISTVRDSQLGQAYAKEQIVLTDEGKALQKLWNNSTTIEEALYINSTNAFFAFNKPIHDHGYIYPNYGHGVVDPLSGVLLWVGFLALLATQHKKREHLLLLVGFSFLISFFALVTTKNPNYTRFLLCIPFVSGLIVMSFALFDKSKRRAVRVVARCIFGCVLVVIALANIVIFADFVQVGKESGNDVGGTARYVEARHALKNYHFYLISDDTHPYYSWGGETQWHRWLSFFTDEKSQTTSLVSPSVADINLYEKPFTLFLSQNVFEEHKQILQERFPHGMSYAITPDGRLQAFEVLE